MVWTAIASPCIIWLCGVIALVWVPVPACPLAPPPVIELQRGVRVVGTRRATEPRPGETEADPETPSLGTLDTPQGPCFSPVPSFEEPP